MDGLDLAFGRLSVDLALKATALLGITALALLALRRASAATRHLVAVAGLVGALALPALSTLLPRWDLPVLPAASRPAAAAPREIAAPPGAAGRLAAVGPADSLEPGAGAERAAPYLLERKRPGIVAIARAVAIAWVAIAWGAVAALLLLRLVVGVLRVRGRASRADLAERAGWAIPFVRASRALGLRRFVRLALSDEIEVPMTAGGLDPVVLLPAGAREWGAERRRVVLLHELAHVKRFDWISQILCESALALWWFHPLAWATAARVRRDAELAADDLVLRTGERPAAYAAHLLEIVRSLRQGEAVGAMAMARRAGFEARLRAILDSRRRGPASPLGRAAAIALSGAALALAAAHPTEARASMESREKSLPPAQAKPPMGVAPAALARIDARIAQVRPVLAKVRDNVRQTTARVLADATRESDYQRGMHFHRGGRYREAIEAFQRAIERGERAAAASYNVACGYARLGERDAAIEWLRKALDAGFDARDYLAGDSDLASLRGDPRFRDLLREAGNPRDTERAVARFERLVASAPEKPDAWYAVGKDLLRVGEYQRAVRAFRESAARSQRPGASLYNAACALSLGGDNDAALDELQRAVEAGFDDPKLFRTDPDLDPIREMPRFREIQRDEEALAMPSLRTRWLADSEAWRDAARRFEQYADAHPRSGRAFFNAGFAWLAAGDDRASAEAFQRALALGYRRGTTLYNLACAEARQEHLDRAFQYLGQAIDAGFDAAGMLRGDDDLDNLRGDPRYRELIRRADARAEAWKH